jgi:hypothetical protein
MYLNRILNHGARPGERRGVTLNDGRSADDNTSAIVLDGEAGVHRGEASGEGNRGSVSGLAIFREVSHGGGGCGVSDSS